MANNLSSSPSTLDLSLYLVTNSDNLPPGCLFEQTVEEAIIGGVTIVQLREKHLSTSLFLHRANLLRQICKSPVKLIINDRIDIALASQADGVHLGQQDMPIPVARKILGPLAIIGKSVNTIDEALLAVQEGATYLGIGTCWPTATKLIPNHKIIGPRGVKSIRDELYRLGYSIPMVVIGGINTNNLIRTLYGSISNQFYTTTHSESTIGLAVVSAVMSSSNPRQAATDLKKLIHDFSNWLQTKYISLIDSNFNPQISNSINQFIQNNNSKLIHHITNTVVQNDCANLALALGCSPLMSSNLNELEDLVSAHSGSLIFNIGTFNINQIDAMKLAGRKANLIGKPIIFDPVGVNATQERIRLANELLNHVQMSVIKGNQAEIATLLNCKTALINSCGVDAKGQLAEPAKIVSQLARREHCVVAMTGETDWISDGSYIIKLQNGIKKLSSITGSGCMTGTSIGCFASVIGQTQQNDSKNGLLTLLDHNASRRLLISAILGISTINISAEITDRWAQDHPEFGPNLLRVKMIDRIYQAEKTGFWDKVREEIKISVYLNEECDSTFS
ncbi:hypothetical protein O181_101820 [Austropuccinia psidii MF-1]|uniref:Thiamine phosphate synthase/TenI domain-containing protein n=1 Tax=Austropuccinia psidii MF-1 TaxID=1389203 RepID=A0A9Q3JIE3_9BASI|nr:hypothetical protein [Austropuccinia psidii MF-1]